MQRRLRLTFSGCAAVAVAGMLAACGGSSASSSAQPGGTATASSPSVVKGPGAAATIRANDDWDTLNPATAQGSNLDFQMSQLLYDHLVYLDPDGQIKPWLATSWQSTPTKTVLHIRKGATCDDGTTLTPTDIANSLNYLANPKTAAPYEQRTFGVGSAHSIGDDAAGTVTITQTKPWGSTMLGLAMPWAGIICPKALADPPSMKQSGGGSGPYTLTSSQRGAQYTLTARKGYSWGPDGWTTASNGVPQTITEKVIENNTTAANAVITGGVTIAPIVGADYARVNATPGFFKATNMDVGGTAITFNETQPDLPGADPMVRRALGLAIDPTDFMKAWTYGHGAVLGTTMTPNMPCYKALPVQPGSLALAKQILASDGYKPGAGGKLEKNGKLLTIRIAGWNVMNAAPEYLLNQLTQLGVSATLTDSDTSTWITTVFTTRKYDMTAWQYQSTFPGPIIIPGQDQGLGVKDSAYFAAVDHAAELPIDQACPAWQHAINIQLAHFHARPLGANITTWFAKGFKLTAAWNYVDPFTLYQTQ